MKISTGKDYKKKHRTLNAIFISNPGLVLGFDLPFLIATSTSLKNAVAMSAEMMGIHIVTMFLSVIFARRLPLWLRSIITVVISAGTMMIIREWLYVIFPDMANTLGMYIYLLAVNGLTLFQSQALHKRSKLIPVMKKEFFYVVSFTLTMFALSIIREYFGSGTLWGIPVSMPFKMAGLSLPFAGFILLGFIMAFIKFFNHKLFGIMISETQRRQSRFAVHTKL